MQLEDSSCAAVMHRSVDLAQLSRIHQHAGLRKSKLDVTLIALTSKAGRREVIQVQAACEQKHGFSSRRIGMPAAPTHYHSTRCCLCS